MKIGANYSQNKTEFVVWAPNQANVSVVLPEENQILKMDRVNKGYWRLEIEGIEASTRYMFRLNDDVNRADPASQYQPDGVFGPSSIVNHSSFPWRDHDWAGVNLRDMIIYELHTGTFSQEGTFAGARSRAHDLSKMGINSVELMPVSQFSGSRNWGYDAVFPFAVQNTYGGPDELKKLIQEFHENGIAVILDVVYNHLGPEGNFLKDFGPYFLFSRMTPWGASINFDGPLSPDVRNFFLENAIHWFKNYHIDGLRLDAVFAIIDFSPKHFLKELSEAVEDFSKTTQRKLLLIAENDSVDLKMVWPRKKGGYSLDALWHDNLHHALHALLTGERNWYYSSFGNLRKVVQAFNENCVGYKPLPTEENSENCSEGFISPSALVVFSQNHDQVGNRPLGERLITIAGLEAAKLAAGLIILSPFTPLLFMGEEYGENAPFLFFTDFSDEPLRKQVQIGRKKELKKNGWKGKATDPQDLSTFSLSKIDWYQRSSKNGRKILKYYQKLIDLRRDFYNDVIDNKLRQNFFVSESNSLLIVQRKGPDSFMVVTINFSREEQSYQFPCDGGTYVKALDSADPDWAGSGSALPSSAKLGDKHAISPLSLAVYLKSEGEKS